MSQIINCRFDIYRMPPNAGFLTETFVPISEQFGWDFFRRHFDCEIVTDHPEVFLNTDRTFIIKAELVNRNQDVKLIPLKWTVEYGGEQVIRINMLARELKLSPFKRWFENIPPGNQMGIAWSVVGVLALAIGFGAYAVLAFPNPEFFWDWVARNITLIGAICLPLSIIAGGILLIKYYKGLFARLVAYNLILLMAPLVCIVWLAWIAPPMSTEPYTKYLENVRSNAGVGAAVFVSLTPWLFVILKALGPARSRAPSW
jgi:hypothetical protein